MPLSFSYLPYSETNAFSQLVTDYLSEKKTIKPFYKFSTDKEGLAKAIDERKSYRVDRKKLVNVLTHQYSDLSKHEAVKRNIASLVDDNTFTVCTAHQPNLMTGYLYFVYKILHAIKLAEELKTIFPENNFVPVYYIGSEDNDLAELGTFRYNNKKFVWDGGGQTGAVGRMRTERLKPLFDELFKEFGPPGDFCEELKQLISDAYLQHQTIAKATQHVVNELFGRFGLVVIDPDNAALKAAFISIMKDDLLRQTANQIVSKQIENLSEHYKVQAHPRAINLFYLKGDLRERIEKADERWSVINTNIRWNKEELLHELNEHPERFSPNVILRALFQETILPNVAFIGGGAEVAYWLQLKTLFDHYRVFFPAVHLRQSVLWISKKENKLRQQLSLSHADIFKPENELVHQFISRNSDREWQAADELKQLDELFIRLRQKAVALDPTLRASAEAALVKMRYLMQTLEKKMLRAEKRRMQDSLKKISKLKGHLFPNNSLQERVENFMSYYLQYGRVYFDVLIENIEPLRHEFLVIEE